MSERQKCPEEEKVEVAKREVSGPSVESSMTSTLNTVDEAVPEIRELLYKLPSFNNKLSES